MQYMQAQELRQDRAKLIADNQALLVKAMSLAW